MVVIAPASHSATAARRRAPSGTGCSARTHRCSDARSYDAVLRPCCRKHVVHLSQVAAQAFAAAGITFWADYGTLLGAVRNPMTTKTDYPWLPQDQLSGGPIPPGIIPHDKDADWGLRRKDFRLALKALQHCTRRRLYVKGQPRLSRLDQMNLLVRASRGSIKLRLSLLNHTNLDLFFWHEREDGTLYRDGYASVDKFKGKEFHRGMLYPLSSVEWEGMTLPAPRDPEAFLAMRYGPNWRTPIAANNDSVPR